MTQLIFLRHFETQVDEDTPVSEWELTEDGEAAMDDLLDSELLCGLDRVYSSPEQKAIRTAGAVANEVTIPLESVDALREVDRSGVGFIEDHDEYVAMVRTYLRNATVSFDWEDRRTVEDRMQGFLEQVEATDDRAMVVSHGLFLSRLLSPLTETDAFSFWQDLRFGETVEVDYEDLVSTL